MSSSIVLAGIIGTLAMTLFVELVSFLYGKPFHVIRVLSRMFHRADNVDSKVKKSLLYCIALIVHYSIGILFAYAFDFVFKQGLIGVSLIQAFIFGSLAGFIGITGWRIFFAVHPNPPKINLPQYLLVIWAGHLIYAVGTFIIYIKFQPAPLAAGIPVC